MKLKWILILLSFLNVLYGNEDQSSLSYYEAEALKRAPEVKKLEGKKRAFEEESVASSQWKDPKLQFGILNLPTNSFSFDKENMTQIKAGLLQEFPRGKSLKLSSDKYQLLAEKTSYELDEVKAKVLLDLRGAWLDLYGVIEEKKILDENQDLLRMLVQKVESKLSSGIGFQHDLWNAKMMQSSLEASLVRNEKSLQQARFGLARYVGDSLANQADPMKLPEWNLSYQRDELIERVKKHSTVMKSDTQKHVKSKDLAISKELYKPAWSIGAYYAYRQGKSPGSSKKRADFVGVQVTTELPFFYKDRQDRKVEKELALVSLSESEKEFSLLELQRKAQDEYVSYKQLESEEGIYAEKYLSEAKLYIDAVLIAYENRQVDFETVVKAFDRLLDVEMQFVKIKTQKAKALAQLKYLEGKEE